jgi:hypothetical protein
MFLKIIYSIYLIITKNFNKWRFSKIVTKNIYVFDIDNTIANTWPFICKDASLYKTYSDLYCFPGMIDFLINIKSDSSIYVLFLSARNPIYYPITKKWLSRQGIDDIHLILVPRVESKINILKDLPKDCSIHFFDDLSYNHENNDIKFYVNVINELDNLKNVTYYGYEYLKSFQ